MNESQLISELCAALDQEAGAVRAPAGVGERARTVARRRRLTHRVIAGVPAVGLLAALVVVATSPQSPGRPPAAPTPGKAQARAGSHQPEVLTAAYVTSRAKAALSKVSGCIVESTGHGWAQWSDPATAAGRLEELGPGGRLTSEEMWTFSGLTERRTYIDYTARTWWESTAKVPAVLDKPDPSSSLPVPGNSASGQVSILGHRDLGGRDTILVQYGPPRGFKPTPSQLWATEQVWLDATTYLPVQTKIFGVGPVEQESLAYLPATLANQAKLTVAPPAGFKQVAPPPFRGDGRPGLGQIR